MQHLRFEKLKFGIRKIEKSRNEYLLFTFFGFRIIGGYMDKNSWIAESEALNELIAQKGCRTFQPQMFQP